MKDYQRRLLDERNALDEKIEALSSFIETRDDLPKAKECLMQAQLSTMKSYLTILDMRINEEDFSDNGL